MLNAIEAFKRGLDAFLRWFCIVLFVILVLLVQLVQIAGDAVVRHVDHR